jgi:hypothetical protein
LRHLQPYAKVENQSGCCAPAQPSTVPDLAVIGGPCCSESNESQLHGALAELLKKYDVNEFAASVFVYAIKP